MDSERKHVSFVDRGDPATVDFDVDDFFCDGAWKYLDLSGIVPAGAKAVLLTVSLQDNEVNTYVSFRNGDNSNVYSKSKLTVQVADIFIEQDVVVPVPTDRVISYKTTNTTITVLNVTVKGWWV